MTRIIPRIVLPLALLLLVCFFMPFLDLCCVGKNLGTLTGVDLACGAVYSRPGLLGTGESETMAPNPLVILALVCAIGGLFLILNPRTRRSKITAACYGIGLVDLILLKVVFDRAVSDRGHGLVSVDYRIGFWFVTVLFGILFIMQSLRVRDASRRLAEQTRTNDLERHGSSDPENIVSR